MTNFYVLSALFAYALGLTPFALASTMTTKRWLYGESYVSTAIIGSLVGIGIVNSFVGLLIILMALTKGG